MADVGDIEACARQDYPRLVGIVAAACGSASIAEEAVQSAFVKAIETTNRGRAIDRVPRRIVAVAVNEARSRWRWALEPVTGTIASIPDEPMPVEQEAIVWTGDELVTNGQATRGPGSTAFRNVATRSSSSTSGTSTDRTRRRTASTSSTSTR